MTGNPVLDGMIVGAAIAVAGVIVGAAIVFIALWWSERL
jgi:hypothetical protein